MLDEKPLLFRSGFLRFREFVGQFPRSGAVFCLSARRARIKTRRPVKSEVRITLRDDEMQVDTPFRRKRALVSILGTTQMHLRSPWVIALWSAIFPGVGHLLLSKYICGFILFIWEVYVNVHARLNLAIFYSFIGRADVAKEVLDKRWLLLYIPVYIFTIWDSYKKTVDMNGHFELSRLEDAPVRPFIINPLGFNYLDKSSPLVNIIWSALAPGTGQLSIQRVMVAFFLVPWWIAVAALSGLFPAIHYTALFQFDKAAEALDKQWFLNCTSLFFYPLYDAYVNTVETNKLYEWELAKYLKREYQDQSFRMPARGAGDHNGDMYIVSNFDYSINVEKAVAELRMKGIAKESILAVPLDRRNEKGKVFDTLHDSDGSSSLDVAFILAALFSLFGAIYGFLLSLGPIIWALIGTGTGFGLGVVIRLITLKRQKKKPRPEAAGVVLIVSCGGAQQELVSGILWDNGAKGAGILTPARPPN